MASIVISDDSASENDTEHFQPFPCRHTAATATVSRSRVQKTCERAPTKERHERAKKRKATTVAEDEQVAKAVAKLERMRQMEEKKRQKEVDKAVKKAAKDTRKEIQGPADRLKQMILVLDSSLSESSDFMEALIEELQEAGVEYRVGLGGPAGSVRWKRKQCERAITEDAQIRAAVTECDENELLVTLESQGFAALVHYTKLEQQGVSLPVSANTLSQYVKSVKRDHRGARVSLAVEGMDAFFRGNKTKANRQFRKRVLGSSSSSSAPDRHSASTSSSLSEVTWLDCQEAIVSLQLQSGCTVRLCTGPEQLAEYILTLTKAVAEKPFRKESPFSFHPDAVTGNKKKVVESGDQLATTWKHQLMQFNNMSESMASAVVAVYPTPSHLLSAYSSRDEQSAALLLQDITVRRGVGSLASTRRLGPVQSRRVHCLLTSADPHVTLT